MPNVVYNAIAGNDPIRIRRACPKARVWLDNLGWILWRVVYESQSFPNCQNNPGIKYRRLGRLLHAASQWASGLKDTCALGDRRRYRGYLVAISRPRQYPCHSNKVPIIFFRSSVISGNAQNLSEQ